MDLFLSNGTDVSFDWKHLLLKTSVTVVTHISNCVRPFMELLLGVQC